MTIVEYVGVKTNDKNTEQNAIIFFAQGKSWTCSL